MEFWGSPIQLDIRPTDPTDTDRSTTETIGRMVELAKDSSTTPLIGNIVDSLVASLPRQHSHRDLARAIWWWTKSHIRYVEDEQILAEQLGYHLDPNQELLISPQVLMSMPVPQGDCDDFSVMIAAMLIRAGMPAWFVTIAVDADQPWRFSHVFVRTWLADERQHMTMDCSHGKYPGWETDRDVYRRIDWPIN